MKVGGNFTGFDISSKGLSVQRKKMNLIAENIANAELTRTEDGKPYKRKFLKVTASDSSFANMLSIEGQRSKLHVTNPDHISNPGKVQFASREESPELSMKELEDSSEGEIVYMPEHPYADSEGYVEMSNVNTVTEMVDMIAASRSYEANLTALNSSKQIAKDSLEI